MPKHHDEVLLEAGTNELEIIEFFIKTSDTTNQKASFGVNVAKVLEIHEAPDGLYSSPGAAHPSFLGTIGLREQILPIIDLSVWLGIERAPSPHELIIVTEFNNLIIGFLVSHVTHIYRVEWADVHPPSQIVANIATNCITATIHFEDHIVQMIDFEKIINELDHTLERASKTPSKRAQQQFRAMVVDDSGTIRAMLEERFEQANFDVLTYKNGRDALEALQEMYGAQQPATKDATDRIDIVIADIEMPSMDGYTLTKSIKTDSKLLHLPVILFSSLITNSTLHKGESVMADAQITKPEFPTLVDKAIELIEIYQKKYK